jgi:hypothetical protein
MQLHLIRDTRHLLVWQEGKATHCSYSIRSPDVFFQKKTTMSNWRDLRDQYGNELHRLNSRGPTFLADGCCSSCHTTTNVLFRCSECSYGRMLCASCMRVAHQHLPFHHIEVCTLAHFLSNLLMPLTEMDRRLFLADKPLRHGLRLLGRPRRRYGLRPRQGGSGHLLRHPHKRPASRLHLVLRLRQASPTLAPAHAMSAMASHDTSTEDRGDFRRPPSV